LRASKGYQVDVAVVEGQVDVDLGVLAHEAQYKRRDHTPTEDDRGADAQRAAYA
jgi:hypothetical protein